MRRPTRLLAALFSLAALALAAPARANGRFPAASAVVFHPADARTIYVRATFGLLVTRDGGDSWRWICEKAIGFSGMEDPTYVVTPKGTLVGGTFSGAAVSHDAGCNFHFSGGANAHVFVDLTTRADGEIVAISSVHAKAAGDLYDNHLAVSKDDGETFTVVGGPIDPKLLLESVEIAPSDPARIYVSAVRGDGDKRTAAFLVTYDGAMTWLERKLELVRGETGPFITVVDPKNADRVYVRTAAAAERGSRLLVTDDAGKTWRKIHDAGSALLGFALADDARRVFVVAREGVASAPTDTFAFTKGSSAEIQCLGARGDALWACSTERSGFLVGVSRNGGRAFDVRLHLDEIKGPLECAAESSVARECSAEWPKLRRELGMPDPAEAPRHGGSSGPALRGREERKASTRSPFAAAAALGLGGMIVYQVLKRIRRRP